MRLGRVLGWGVRLIAGTIGIVLFVFLVAVLVVAFEGRSTFPAPLRADAVAAQHMPEFRYREAYEVGVDAPPARVYEAVRTADLRRIPALRVMLEARGAPALLRSLAGSTAYRRPARVTLDTLGALRGFAVLGETPGHSIVLGKIDRPWDAKASRPSFTPASFGGFNGPGYVKTVVSVEAVPRSGGGTRLTVEWRVSPTDEEAMRRLGRYWIATRPFAQLATKTGLPRIGAAADSAHAREQRRRTRLADSASSSPAAVR